ncbi:unnamed protein product, partial [Ectocarpus sp. 12 AP-2014]
MNPLKICVTAAALLFSASATAQEAKFSEIDVLIDLSGGESANAIDFWPEIEADMEAIMLQRISTIYDPNGLYVTVSVTEISLDGTRGLVDKGEFNTLRGLAYVREEEGGAVIDALAFGLRAQPWEVGVVDGMTTLADKEDFYVAMLNRFADSMVSTIND